MSLTTFGYELARRNRISQEDLEPGKSLDIKAWPPLFVYDVLQLPGSLATVLGHLSSLDFVPRMTPGKVAASDLRLHRQRGRLLIKLPQEKAGLVQGMLLFCRGKRNREALKQHYGSGYRRTRVDVELMSDKGPKTLRAYVWVPKGKATARRAREAEAEGQSSGEDLSQGIDDMQLRRDDDDDEPLPTSPRSPSLSMCD